MQGAINLEEMEEVNQKEMTAKRVSRSGLSRMISPRSAEESGPSSQWTNGEAIPGDMMKTGVYFMAGASRATENIGSAGRTRLPISGG